MSRPPSIEPPRTHKVLRRTRPALLLLLLLAAPARAELLPVKTYTSVEGLIYEKINRIYQDSRGFIWVTTPVGISRFDGHQFVNYGMDDDLPVVLMTDMIEGDGGVYWFGTQTGIVYRFDPRAAASSPAKKRFESFSVEPKGSYIHKFYRGRGGAIYVATAAGLFVLDDRGANKFTRVELNVMNAKPGETHAVYALAEDAEGGLWVGHQYGVTRRLPSGATIHYEVKPAGGLDRIRYLAFAADGRLWLLTDNRGVVVFRPEPADTLDASQTERRKLRYTTAHRMGAGLPGGFAYEFTKKEAPCSGMLSSVVATSDGKVWFAAYGKGLVEFDGRGFRLYTKQNGLSDNTVMTLIEDSVGNLWVGSMWGLMKLSRPGFVTYNTADGLADERVLGLFLDRRNTLHVLTPEWTLNRFDGEKYEPIKVPLPGSPPMLANQFVADSRGEWWFATSGGLYRYVGVDDTRRLAASRPAAVYRKRDGLAGEEVFSVFEDTKGDVWASFTDAAGSLSRWRRATGEFETYTKDDGIPEGCVVRFFREDGGGNLLMACRDSSVVLRREGRFITFQSEQHLPKGWWIGDVQVDRKGRVWVAVPVRGLLRIDGLAEGDPAARLYTKADGLSDIHIQFVAEDNEGKIYFVNSRGMDVLEPETGRVRQYTLADGLAAAGAGAGLRDADGNLWLGAHRGISRFTPRDEKTQAPAVYIGGLRVAGRSVALGALGETEVSGLELQPDERQIQIDFFGLALAPGEVLRYQYKLVGADDDWSAPTAERTANYPNVPPGSYRFLVRAVNSDGVPSPAPAAVSFIVLRPVWQRWWFLSLAALAALAAAYQLYRFRVARLVELERVRTRIATDLHDDIGASLSRMAILSEVVKQQRGDADEQSAGMLTEIAESARGLVDSMGDIVWSIDPRRDDLASVVRRVRQFASDVLEPNGVRWRFELPPEVAGVKLDPEKRRHLYLIFKEGINNVARHAGDCTEVSLSLAVSGNKLCAEISDDGRGFNGDAHANGSSNGRGGNGLPNMRARAEQMGGRLDVVSAPRAGTRLRLKVPLK